MKLDHLWAAISQLQAHGSVTIQYKFHRDLALLKNMLRRELGPPLKVYDKGDIETPFGTVLFEHAMKATAGLGHGDRPVVLVEREGDNDYGYIDWR